GATRPAGIGPAHHGLPEGRQPLREDVEGGAEPDLVDEPERRRRRAHPEARLLPEVRAPAIEERRPVEWSRASRAREIHGIHRRVVGVRPVVHTRLLNASPAAQKGPQARPRPTAAREASSRTLSVRPRASYLRRWATLRCRLRKDDVLLADAILGDLITHGAPAVLDDAQEGADAVADALAPHDQDGVGDGADVPGRHLAGDEVLELGLLGRDQEQRGHPRVVVAMVVDERAVPP